MGDLSANLSLFEIIRTMSYDDCRGMCWSWCIEGTRWVHWNMWMHFLEARFHFSVMTSKGLHFLNVFLCIPLLQLGFVNKSYNEWRNQAIRSPFKEATYIIFTKIKWFLKLTYLIFSSNCRFTGSKVCVATDGKQITNHSRRCFVVGLDTVDRFINWKEVRLPFLFLVLFFFLFVFGALFVWLLPVWSLIMRLPSFFPQCIIGLLFPNVYNIAPGS
jgi:hypothetical protein